MNTARDLAESYARVEPVMLHAMSWAAELGVGSVSPATGAALRLLAATARAKAVVEVGTGLGISALWLVRGMRPDGVLTSIEIEAEHQAMARQCLRAAGVAPGRTRLITGSSRQVLARLADEAYDIVFVDGAVADYPNCVEQAHRLLRDGGLVIIHHAAAEGLGEHEALVVRQLAARLRDTPEWSPTMLGVGAGLLCATKIGPGDGTLHPHADR